MLVDVGVRHVRAEEVAVSLQDLRDSVGGSHQFVGQRVDARLQHGEVIVQRAARLRVGRPLDEVPQPVRGPVPAPARLVPQRVGATDGSRPAPDVQLGDRCHHGRPGVARRLAEQLERLHVVGRHGALRVGEAPPERLHQEDHLVLEGPQRVGDDAVLGLVEHDAKQRGDADAVIAEAIAERMREQREPSQPLVHLDDVGRSERACRSAQVVRFRLPRLQRDHFLQHRRESNDTRRQLVVGGLLRPPETLNVVEVFQPVCVGVVRDGVAELMREQLHPNGAVDPALVRLLASAVVSLDDHRRPAHIPVEVADAAHAHVVHVT